MNTEESISFRALSKTTEIMQYEALISRHGIIQPDSNFIWRSTFQAPLGININGERGFFDIFLNEGAENEPDKKLFLNRVDAKLKDGIWHVRRTDEELKGSYGNMTNFPLLSFNSLFNDYSYIANGRIYIHLLFNENDLSAVSRAFLSIDTAGLGIRLEFLRRLKEGATAFCDLKEREDASSVTIEISSDGNFDDEGEAVAHFLMNPNLKKGVRTLLSAPGGKIPEIMKPLDPQKINDNVTAFYCSNEVIFGLMKKMFEESIIFFGYHGFATENKISLTVNLPDPLKTSLIRVVGKVENEVPDYSIRIREVVEFAQSY